MKDQDKTKDQLIQELAAMRQRMAELESAETERALIEDALREKTHLNQVLLDAFPCVALLLRPGTREVVASNQAAVEAGAVPGAQCYATWRQREDPCPWCLAPRACATGEAQRLEVDALDIVWDAHWIPVADDLYMHFAFDVTERVQTEAHRDAMLEALRESEEKLRAVLAAVPDLVIVLDAEGRYRDVFTAVPDLLVVPADQLLGKTVHDVMPREDAQPMQETINRALLSRGLERHEYSLEIDGARRWFVARVAALEYQGSDCVLWFARDITEHKQAEEEIKSAGRRWRLLLESIPSFAAEIDLEGRVIDVNKVQPGFSKADFVGRLVSEFAYPENLKQWQIAFSQVVEGGVSATYEAPDYGPGGGLAWYHCHLAPVMEGDKVQSLILVLTDLTEHKRADETLQESKNELQVLFDNMSNGFAYHKIVTDEAGVPVDYIFLEINRAFESYTGLKRDHIIGKRVTEVHPGIEKMEFDWIGKYGKVALGGEPITFEQYFEPQDHWYSIVAYSPVRGYFAVTFEDITERVQADEQLRASLKEKEALLRELYHRTKNNMQVISSILALQAARIQDEQMLSIFRETENRIRSMALVHQKLYQSQNLSRIDLQEYVTDLVALLMQSHEASPDKIALVLDTESVSVLIDTAIPCGLVLNELLSNTFKHAFPGDRSGEIKIRLCRAQDGTVELEVSDDGGGVPEDSDLRKSNTLGMLTVFGIVERQLQGQVTVETEGGVAWRIRFKDDLYAPRV